jgi:hypothetical protein
MGIDGFVTFKLIDMDGFATFALTGRDGFVTHPYYLKPPLRSNTYLKRPSISC